MAKRHLILSVDVGTTKVSAMVSERREDDELVVLGIAATPVTGMRRGLVYEVERVATAIRDSVNRANSMAGTELTHAAISVNGEHLSMTAGAAETILTTGTVREEDYRQVLQHAGNIPVNAPEEAFEIIRRGIAVDGFRGVTNPVGMVGHHLDAEVFVVSGQDASLKNLRRVLTMAGITPLNLVSSPHASAVAVVSDEEKHRGCVVLDVGGGTTGITIFRDGHLQYMGVVPIGGDSITSDLAMGLGVVATQAERLKLEYASITGTREGTLEVRAVSGQSVKLIPVKEMKEIVVARMEEWTRFVEDHLARIAWQKAPSAGVVMTGGGSLLSGFPDYLQERWGWPVRVGVPIGLTGLSDLTKSPGYATVVGVARSSAFNDAEEPFPDTSFGSRMKKFYENFLRKK